MSKAAVKNIVTTQIAAPGAVASGDVLEGAGGIGVYSTDAASGEQVTVIYGGIVELTKETPLVISPLDQVYWDATNNRVDKTNTNIPCGLAADDAASGDTTVRVILNMGAGDA